jgi:hypothetical protein
LHTAQQITQDLAAQEETELIDAMEIPAVVEEPPAPTALAAGMPAAPIETAQSKADPMHEAPTEPPTTLGTLAAATQPPSIETETFAAVVEKEVNTMVEEEVVEEEEPETPMLIEDEAESRAMTTPDVPCEHEIPPTPDTVTLATDDTTATTTTTAPATPAPSQPSFNTADTITSARKKWCDSPKLATMKPVYNGLSIMDTTTATATTTTTTISAPSKIQLVPFTAPKVATTCALPNLQTTSLLPTPKKKTAPPKAKPVIKSLAIPDMYVLFLVAGVIRF